MSKINQIESALKEIDGGKFQKLADAYLSKKNYLNINPFGSVVGKDKVRKGTPDSYARQANGKLIFAEHTTDQTNLLKKLKDDIEKCLDESKTGVSIDQIEEIVICHNSLLSPSDEQVLINIGKKNGIKIQLYGIGTISYDLYLKYPNLALDFLGISIDTGQILEPSVFISEVEKNEISTPLDTQFCNREDDLKEIVEGIKNSQLAVISGAAGVGKSRIALEAMQTFKECHNSFELYVIHNKGLDLYEDIKSYFSKTGDFLILVDDANRVSQFNHIVDLVQNQRRDQNIKVIATVRDYAKEKVSQLIKPLANTSKFELKPMSESEIKGLIKTQYNINNPIYLDRITKIAGGNPRLAVMAAVVPVKENKIESISDVSALYDNYFSSVSDDLTKLQDDQCLKVAGIISFFRTIDRTDEKIMNIISSIFGIDSENFWKAVQYLHSMEAVDIYENEIVKITDQVFSSYLFNLVMFKKGILDFSILLDNFFPSHINKIKDALYPCFNSFGFSETSKKVKPIVESQWEIYLQNNDKNLLAYIKAFWFLLESDVLIYVKDHICKLETHQIDINTIDFDNKNESLDGHPILDILSLFRHSGDSNSFQMALELVLEFHRKNPHAASQTLYVLSKKFGFDLYSHNHGYSKQLSIIKTLWNKTENGKNTLFSRLFINVSTKYLPTEYEYNQSSNSTLTIHTIRLFNIEPLHELREVIWKGIQTLYDTPIFQREVLKTIEHYCGLGYRLENKSIIEKDSEHILFFFDNKLSSSSFPECLIVQKYHKMLLRHEFSMAYETSMSFQSDIYKLYQLLTFDYPDVDNVHQFEVIKKEKIQTYTNTLDQAGFQEFTNQTIEILSELENDRNLYQVRNAIVSVFDCLYESNKNLFIQVLSDYLKNGNLLKIEQPYPIVDKLIRCGSDMAIQILDNHEYALKNRWLFSYYQNLPDEKVTPVELEKIYELYDNSVSSDYPHGFDYLLKFMECDHDIVVNVIKTIIHKSNSNEVYGHSLGMLFNPHADVNKSILKLFEHNLPLLKEAYLLNNKISSHSDFDGSTLSRILSVDPDFILEIVDQVYSIERWPSNFSDDINYSFLWGHKHCSHIVSLVVNDILKREGDDGIYISSGYLGRLFCLGSGNNQPTDEVINNQNEFLVKFIEQNNHNIGLMRLIFRVISNFEDVRKIKFVQIFLTYNKSNSDFESISLEPSSGSWMGSAVPYYQKKVDFWESLLPFCNTLDLIEHKHSIEKQVQIWKERVEHEKKSEFIDDD